VECGGWHGGPWTVVACIEVVAVSDKIVVDAIKLILLIYNNFSIVKKIVNKIERVKQPKVVTQGKWNCLLSN